MPVEKCDRCNGSGWRSCASIAGMEDAPMLLRPIGIVPCTRCGGSGKTGFDDELIAKLVEQMRKKPKLKDVPLRDVEHFQTFYLNGVEYIKRGRNKALWVEKDTMVLCYPDNMVQIKEE